DKRTPVSPRAARRSRSAAVCAVGSPLMNSTRHVVHRALPPHACRMSTCASCSIARTNLFPFATSNVPNPSTVSFGIRELYRLWYLLPGSSSLGFAPRCLMLGLVSDSDAIANGRCAVGAHGHHELRCPGVGFRPLVRRAQHRPRSAKRLVDFDRDRRGLVVAECDFVLHLVHVRGDLL